MPWILIFNKSLLTTGHLEMISSVPSQTALLTKVGACWAPVFSPNGAQIVFLSDLNGLPQVWRVDLPGGWPTPVTVFDDPISQVSWSPVGDWLAFSIAPAGGMNEQLYIVHPDGTDIRRLTDNGDENNRLARWLPDGKTIVYFSNRRSREKMDLYIRDITKNSPQCIARDVGDGLFSDFLPENNQALLVRRLNRSDENLYLIDLQQGKEHKLTPHEGVAQFLQARFSPDGKEIYLATNLGCDRAVFAKLLWEAEFDSLPVKTLRQRNGRDLQNFVIHPDGKSAVLLWNENGLSDMEWVSLTTDNEGLHLVSPADVITRIEISPDGKFLAIAAAGPTLPENIYLLELQTGLISPLTTSPHAGIPLQTLIQPKLITYKSHDNRELDAWLYTPKNFSPPGPLVLSFHGGPETQELPIFNSTYQALLHAGIAIMAPNIRGSSGYGKDFMNLDNGIGRIMALEDIHTSAEYICQGGYSKPQCLGIMGVSYGGYLTVSGLAFFPKLFAAGITISGFVNFETFFSSTEPWIASISKIKYGDPQTDQQMLHDLSPIHHAHMIEAPLLILHGENDRNVPKSEPEQLVKLLQQKNNIYEQYIYNNEGHQFKQGTVRVKANEAIVNWFKRYLRQ